MSRFDYVKYDTEAERLQAAFKDAITSFEKAVEAGIESPRAKALVMTKLEEAYMWIGKGIRDDQLARNEKTELQEGRKNG